MLPRRKAPKSGIRSDKRNFPSHLAWVRKFVCVAFKAAECDGRMEAHHVKETAGGGMGIKPADYWAVPLCSHHHATLHQIGAKSFEAKYAVNLIDQAQKLAATSPYKREWETE